MLGAPPEIPPHKMSEESREAQKKLWTDPAKTKLFVGEFPPIVGLDWGLGVCLSETALEKGHTCLEWVAKDILGMYR